MIDIIIELLTQVKDELLYNEDSWGTLSENQINRILHSRCKVFYVITMLEGIKKQLDSFNNLIKFMR